MALVFSILIKRRCWRMVMLMTMVWFYSTVESSTLPPPPLPPKPLPPLIPVLVTLAPPNNFCEPEVTPMAEPLFTCGTCAGRCGTLRQFIRAWQHKPPRYCNCDSKCIAYGDCCYDFESKCPEDFSQGAKFKEMYKYNVVRCERIATVKNSAKPVVEIRGIVPSFPEYTFISGCGTTGTACPRTSEFDLLKPNLALPVTDKESGLHFINFQCAKCNGVKDITWWTPQLACDTTRVDIANGSFVIETEEDLKHYLSMCTVHYVIPKSVTPRYNCQPFNRKCPQTCNNSALVEKCEQSFVTDYVEGSQRYDNYYCAVCNGEQLDRLLCPQIEEFEVLPGGRGTSQFSLSLLFDFDPSEGLVVGQRPCPPYQERVGDSRECRQVGCPEDLRFVDSECLATSLNVTFISASLTFNNTNDVKKALEELSNVRFAEAIQEKLDMNLQLLLNETGIKDVTLKVVQGVKVVDAHGLNLTLIALLQFGINSTFIFETHADAVMSNITKFTNNEIILALQAQKIDLAMVEIEIDGQLVFRQSPLSECSWFLFKEDEFNIVNSSLILSSTSQVYSGDRFRLLEGTALVCVGEESKDPSGLNLDVSPALGIITIVFISLSIICLVMRIILQFKIRYYKSHAAKLHFNLSLALCLAFLMLLVGGVVALYEIQTLCVASGVLMYWFFMAAFFWMTAIAYDTWVVFRPSSQFVRAEDTQKSLMGYILPCWGLPAIVACIVVGLDFTDIDPRFQAKFGLNICWFNQRYALLVYLGIPMAVSTFSSCILFILIVFHLRRTIQQSVRPPSEKQNHQFPIYLRLFALMGISWVFGFVAAFVGHDALWIIFILLNASQGIFLFISFVLRRPVLRELRKRYRELSETSTRSTNSTSLSASSHINPNSRNTKSNPDTTRM